MKFGRGDIAVKSDSNGVSVHDGHEGVFFTHDEWRWLVTMVGPALIPREPTVAEKLEARRRKTAEQAVAAAQAIDVRDEDQLSLG